MSFLGKSNSSKTPPTVRYLSGGAGFTLIELLVVIIILGILVGFVLTTLNPVTQIKKSQDSQRQHDLKQLATALDSYYNNSNFYPQSLSTLTTAKTIQTIPNDPTASLSWPNFAYIMDSSDPQWNVLFAKLAFPSSSSFSCPLEQMKNSSGKTCVPLNYSSLGYNYCVISGNVKCDKIVDMRIAPLPITTSQIIYWRSQATGWINGAMGCQAVSSGMRPEVSRDRYCACSPVNRCTPDI